ncbi:unnamed protein product [Camellia sinensis]
MDGHILAHILAATSIGVISATAFHYYHRQMPQKQLEDQTVVPLLDRNESGCVAKLERFSNYVARQIGFEDGSECPQLCKLTYEYLKKSKECESTIYEYFADEPHVDELYVKLVEEFDRCILAYFAFHWSQASLMISQDENVASDDAEDDGDANGSRQDRKGDEVEEEDEGRHAKMLQEITRLPAEAFEGNISHQNFNKF